MPPSRRALSGDPTTSISIGIRFFAGTLALLEAAAGVLPSGRIAAQEATLIGVVAEQETERLIPAATVTLVGTGLATRTDADGTFELRNVPLGRYLVRVEAEGFPAVVEEVEITPGLVPLPVFLQSVVAALDGIVAFGRPRNRGAGAAKSAADLVAEKIPRLKPLADGSTQQRSVPKTFSLRGRNSFSSASEPIIVVDGIKMSGGMGNALEVLRRIPASDVKSVQILRGATASFLYGAADGAIVVDTQSRQPPR